MKKNILGVILGLTIMSIPTGWAQEKLSAPPTNSIKPLSTAPTVAPLSKEASGVLASPSAGVSSSVQDTTPTATPSPTVPPIDASKVLVPGDIDFRETDIRAAFDILTQKTGVAIDAPSGLSGAVTLGLKDVPLEDILCIMLNPRDIGFVSGAGKIKIILAADQDKTGSATAAVHGRAVRLTHTDPHRRAEEIRPFLSKQGRVWVDARDPVVYLVDVDENLKKAADDLTENDFPPLQTEIFSLAYADVKKVAVKVKDMVTPKLGTVRTDEASNALVVTDTAPSIEQVEEFIKRLDKRLEVILNVAIYKVQLNEEHQDGIDWEAIVANFKKFDLLSEDGTASRHHESVDGKSLPPPAGGKNRLCLGTLSAEDYEILLEALDTVGTVTRLEEQQVTALMNHPVTVKVDTTGKLPAPPVGATRQGGLSLPLVIKPYLTDGNTLILDLSPRLVWREDGPLRLDAALWEDFSPQASIQVDMGDKGVLVIGGLLREKEVQKISKFPLLGDLPIFSLVFRHQNRWIERTEYLVFIVAQVNRENSEK